MYNCNDSPRLIVLGTGCATPSTNRGASGYALVLPVSTDDDTIVDHTRRHENEIYLLDCGEGVSTMLSRNCGRIHDWKERIRGIWISHAHLDHYGGLPTMVRLLFEHRNQSNTNKNNAVQSGEEEPFPKRQKYRFSKNEGRGCVPFVIAPAKVLRYLDIILNCHHGWSVAGAIGVKGAGQQQRRQQQHQYFEPRLHWDPSIPPGPWTHFENIKVDHNCCPAFGLLIGWKIPASKRDNHNDDNGTKFSHRFLCYSGDTRPSNYLVQRCQRAVKNCYDNNFARNNYHRRSSHYLYKSNGDADLFLIHEATFQDNDANMAIKKKHSTIGEAYRIACDIPACSRVLLTHFSQRYNSKKESSRTSSLATVMTNANNLNASGTNGKFNNNTNNDVPPLMGLAADGLWIRL